MTAIPRPRHSSCASALHQMPAVCNGTCYEVHQILAVCVLAQFCQDSLFATSFSLPGLNQQIAIHVMLLTYWQWLQQRLYLLGKRTRVCACVCAAEAAYGVQLDHRLDARCKQLHMRLRLRLARLQHHVSPIVLDNNAAASWRTTVDCEANSGKVYLHCGCIDHERWPLLRPHRHPDHRACTIQHCGLHAVRDTQTLHRAPTKSEGATLRHVVGRSHLAGTKRLALERGHHQWRFDAPRLCSEPCLPPGLTAVRWPCACGQSLLCQVGRAPPAARLPPTLQMLQLVHQRPAVLALWPDPVCPPTVKSTPRTEAECIRRLPQQAEGR